MSTQLDSSVEENDCTHFFSSPMVLNHSLTWINDISNVSKLLPEKIVGIKSVLKPKCFFQEDPSLKSYTVHFICACNKHMHLFLRPRMSTHHIEEISVHLFRELGSFGAK